MAEYSGTGMLSPNQPIPKADPKVSDQEPTEAEKELCKQIDKLLEKGQRSRKKYDQYWVDNYRMFRGDQWLRKRPSYKSKEVINLIFQTIQSQAATMLDTRPQVGFLPEEPMDLPLSEILTQLFQAEWDKNNWLDELTQIIFDAHIYSVGYSYQKYDKDLYHGAGGVQFCCEDPFNYYPDPCATNVNKKAEWFIDAHPEDIDKLKKKYADSPYVHMIKPDLEDLETVKKYSQTLHIRRNTDLDINSDKATLGFGNEERAQDKALVITAYLKPSDTEQIEQDDLDSQGEKIYITKLKYPRGRKVVKINNYIFEDTELEYDHLEFPFARCVNYVLPREFFGISELDNTKGPQMVFNKFVNFAIDILTLMGNPIWLNPVEGNVNSRKLNSAPGLVVDFTHADGRGKPERVEGLGLQPSVLDMIDRMEKWFNDSAGTQDVTRGVNPPGVTANAAIETLLESAQKRVKQKMRHVDSFLKDFGKQWVSLVFQYYTSPRIYRITNKDESNTYFKFNVEDRPEVDEFGQPVIGADGQQRSKKFAIVRRYAKNQDGILEGDAQPSEYEIRGEWDVRVNTVSGLPFFKAENEQRLMQLFDRGIIDAQEVLMKMDYPNYEAVLQRVQEQQAAMAEAQAQQQAAPAQGAV